MRRTFLVGAAAATTPPSRRVRRQDRDWEQRAEDGIRSTRMSDLEVRVVDASSGEPVPDATVDVEMQTHEFCFGTAVDAEELVAASDDDPYRSRLLELFNTAVFETAHKWKNWETGETAEVADRAVQWLRANGLDVRGHAAIWQNLEVGAVPDDVVTKLESADPDRDAYLADRTTDHVWDIVTRYRDELTEWDVLNEHLDYFDITAAIDPAEPPQEAPVLVEWYETAAAAAPGIDRYYNDFDIITGGEQRRTELETLLASLGDAGAIEGLGMQAHFDGRDAAIGPDELRALLDRYASYGVDLKVTEYDTYGSGWTEAAEAEHLAVVLKTLFGHPAATGFLMWGFWDGNHWRDNAPLFRDDWSKKPAYDVYTDLVFDEWWTEETGVTDSNGYFGTRAFHGEYEITATVGGESTTIATSVTPADSTDTAIVRLD